MRAGNSLPSGMSPATSDTTKLQPHLEPELMFAAAHVAPTPGGPAASSLSGGDAAGLTVVEGAHWSERLQVKSCGVDDRYVLATPLAGTAVGLFVHFELWTQLPYLVPAGLVVAIVSRLASERVQKFEKRQRRAAAG